MRAGSIVGNVALALAAAHAARRAIEWGRPLRDLLGIWFWALVVALACAVLLSVRNAMCRRRRSTLGRSIRCATIVVVGAATTFVTFCHPFSLLQLELVGGLAALAIALGNATAWRVLPARVEVVAFNLCLAVVLAELGLKVVAGLSRSPVFMTSAATIGDRIELYRPAPGTRRFGFPVNSMGHYDTEFLPGPERTRPVVAMIGDSFSAGIVPYAHHFSTVCEDVNPSVEVYNFGVPAIGPQHYAHLLAHEVLPLSPDAVIVNVFVGNDFTDRDLVTSAWWTHWLDRDKLLLCVVPRRLAVVIGEAEGDRVAGTVQGEQVEDPRAFDWMRDYRSERPTFSRQRYVAMERSRARALTALGAADVDWLVDTILDMRDLAATTPFGIVVIPDVFQVDDALWAELGCDDGERDRAQRLLAAEMGRSGVPVLDLLPVMREQPLEPDGCRHLYHLHDSHFNTRGNAVAGRAMAAFVERLLAD